MAGAGCPSARGLVARHGRTIFSASAPPSPCLALLQFVAWYAENIDTTGASANQILSLVEAAERSGAFASPTKKGVAYLAAFAAADAQRATLTAVLKIESSAAAASSAAAEAVQALAAEAAACSEAGAQRAAAAVSAAAAIAALAEADAATQLLRAAAESAVKRVGDDGLRAAGLSAWQLRAVGYKSGDVKRLGYTARQACNAGFNRAELVAAGYNAREVSRVRSCDQWAPSRRSAPLTALSFPPRASAQADPGLPDLRR